jgi:hypothetical protein
MILDNINDFAIIIINIILYVITIIIAVITFASFSNLFTFNIYNIHSIFKQYIYETSEDIILKDIYSFMLINYIYRLNKQNTLELKLIRDNNKKYKIGDTTNLKFKDDIDKIFSHIQNKDDNKIPKAKKTIMLTKTEENLLINYIKMNDYEIMLKANYKDKSNKDYYKYKATYYSNISYYNALEISDTKASYLYIHICNKFYEIIVILILIILAIILTIFLLSVALILYGKFKGKDGEYGSNILSYIFKQNNWSIIVSIISISLYSILHGLIYKNIFIDTVYNGLYDNYKELLHPDIYVRTEINNIYGFINNIKSSEIKEFLYDNNINILKILAKGNEDIVLDSVINKKETIVEQGEDYAKYVEKLLNTNKNFRISQYKSNKYILKYIEHILNIHPSNNYSIDNNYISSSMFLYIIYSYFINNNLEDPHIINKLNKILLNEKVMIGNDDVDDDIEYSLLLKSLLSHSLDNDKMIGEINIIMKDVMILYEEHYNLNIEKYTGDIHNKNILLSLNYEKMPSLIKKDLEKKINKFCDLLKESSNNINFGKHIFNINIYLILELALNILFILYILVGSFSEIWKLLIIIYVYISNNKLVLLNNLIKVALSIFISF